MANTGEPRSPNYLVTNPAALERKIDLLLDGTIRARTRINLLFRYGPDGYVRESWVFPKDPDEESKPKKQKTSGSGAGASQESEDSSGSSD